MDANNKRKIKNLIQRLVALDAREILINIQGAETCK